LPNGASVSYGSYTVPCCKSCDSLMGEKIEEPTLARGVVDTYMQSRQLAGDNHLIVVDSLDEANALLGMNAPNFEVIG